jgi:hypothetical protein
LQQDRLLGYIGCKVMKKKTVEQYVDQGMWMDVGPTFSKLVTDKTVYSYGVMLDTPDAVVKLEAVFIDNILYRLQPQQIVSVKHMMPNMGTVWGKVENIHLDNTYLAFHGFMNCGTLEEFVKLVYGKHDEQFDIL